MSESAVMAPPGQTPPGEESASQFTNTDTGEEIKELQTPADDPLGRLGPSVLGEEPAEKTPDTEAETPDADPEVAAEPQELSDAELEAKYESLKENESLTGAEYKRVEKIRSERAELQATLRTQDEFARQAFPLTIQGIVQHDLADLGLDQSQQEVLIHRLNSRLISGEGSLARVAKQVFEGPLVRFAANQLVDVMKEAGLPASEATAKVFKNDFYFRDYIATAVELGKEMERKGSKGAVKKEDINLAWLEKNTPKVLDEFHKKWPERGGKAKPSDGSASPSGGKLTKDRIAAMPQSEYNELRSTPEGRDRIAAALKA